MVTMAAAPEILLTEEQRLEFTQIPQNISEWKIAKYYTLTEKDIEIINRHRRDYNRLGFAIQLCCLRNPGWSLGNVSDIPLKVMSYITEQLEVNPNEYEQYAQRENTRLEHLQELRQEYGYTSFTENDSKYLYGALMPYAMENDNAGRLISWEKIVESVEEEKNLQDQSIMITWTCLMADTISSANILLLLLSILNSVPQINH